MVSVRQDGIHGSKNFKSNKPDKRIQPTAKSAAHSSLGFLRR